ncbi:uncharacterized protein ISCGN_000566 [Ixodes scapularis]
MRPLLIALFIWNLVLVLRTCDCRSMGQRWSRVRKVILSSSHGVHQVETATQLDPGSNIVFPQRPMTRPACKKTVIFNRPGSLRGQQRNRGHLEGRRLRKVKVVKKYPGPKLFIPTSPSQKQEFGHIKHSHPTEEVFRLQPGASPGQKLFFKSTERTRPEFRQIVFLSGAHSRTPDYGSGWGRAMNDVTIVHNQRKYTLNTRSKAKLKGFPGLVVHVKKMR